MKTRREFIRNMAVGSATLSAGFAIPELNARQSNAFTPATDEKTAALTAAWKIEFDDKTETLHICNGPFSMKGKMLFLSHGNAWKFARSRDGVAQRYAIVDLEDNVQGYVTFLQDEFHLNILFYHRTAQAYKGVLTLEAEITFFTDSFPCRTRAEEVERVLSLRCGMADSLLNDSLFSPEQDTVLQLDAAKLNIGTLGAGCYASLLSGEITESSEAVFRISLLPDYFKNRYVPYYRTIDRKRCPKAPTGWMSWNTYFDKATAEDNLAEARIGQKYLQPFGCEIWSIESWQGNSDQLPVRNFYNMNLEVNEKQFPKGMKKLADDIRKLGFRPGLWMAPFGTGNHQFYKAHKKWFLHDKKGNPISSWNGIYTLDPTVGEAREHLRKIHKIASRQWGYEFFKIDGMSGRNHGYCAHLYERPQIKECFSDPSCPNPFELCVKAIREGIGEDRIFLACQGHTSGPEALYADASRMGSDIVFPNNPVKWANVLLQGRCTINQIFTHNIVLIADPDTLLVRDLPIEQARVTATIVALPGQLTFFGDKLAGLPKERMKMLQQTLPVADVFPNSLYPFFHLLPVWNLQVKNRFLGNYHVIALFNWEDGTKDISFTTKEIGADPGLDYTLFEFWTERYLGTMKESFSMEVPPRSVRLLTMHPVKNIPQWIGSDRHIAQYAVELIDYAWNNENRILKGSIHLVESFPITVWIRTPDGYTVQKTDCKKANCTLVKNEKEYFAVTFKGKKSGNAMFEFQF